MKYLEVGKSGVTPCKHYLLDKLIGREFGVHSRNPLGIKQVVMIDLTAGDGVGSYAVNDTAQLPLFDNHDQAFRYGCSPGIFLHHLNRWAQADRSLPVALYLVERQSLTFQTLLSNVENYLDNQPYWRPDSEDPTSWTFDPGEDNNVFAEVCNEDIVDWCLKQSFNEYEAVFLYNDPNHIKDWSLSSEFLNACPRFTTSLSTLGCNVGGLKRLPLQERMLWFDKVNDICRNLLQPWHDAALFSINNQVQWAYLITAPAVWRDKIAVECLEAASKIRDTSKKSPTIAWYKTERQSFDECLNYLFLTSKERENGIN